MDRAADDTLSAYKQLASRVFVVEIVRQHQGTQPDDVKIRVPLSELPPRHTPSDSRVAFSPQNHTR